MTIAELFAYRREHGICEIRCVNTNGVFEDSFIEPGMKFKLLDIQLNENASDKEHDNCYRLTLDAETHKEHNRKFYTYTYWDNEHNPTWNCEEAGMWQKRQTEYMMGCDSPFDLIRPTDACQRCDGSGFTDHYPNTEECPECQGKGIVFIDPPAE